MKHATSDGLIVKVCDGDITLERGCLSPDLQGVEVCRCADDPVTIEAQCFAASRHHIEVIRQVRGIRPSGVLVEQLKGAPMNDECSPKSVAAESTRQIRLE